MKKTRYSIYRLYEGFSSISADYGRSLRDIEESYTRIGTLFEICPTKNAFRFISGETKTKGLNPA